MSGFGILMLIFAYILLLTELYMFTRHKIDLLTGIPAFKNISIDEYIIGILGIVFNFQ